MWKSGPLISPISHPALTRSPAPPRSREVRGAWSSGTRISKNTPITAPESSPIPIKSKTNFIEVQGPRPIFAVETIFTLTDTITGDLSDSYLVTRVANFARVAGSCVEYGTAIDAIPSSFRFRPPRTTPRPVARGARSPP